MLISNQLIIKARSLLALVVLISFHGTALADESKIAFDIDAQELGAALNEFALQSNKEILFVEAETADKSATKVSGTYAPTAALELLLADTGLEYRVNELDTVLVGAAAEQRGASDSKNLTPTPVLMAQNHTSQAQTMTTSSRTEEGGTSIVTGKVTDARTGANLKGAKVTIEETGQWTSTNDLGEFRFVNVPTGSATLTVSYLGYAGQSVLVGVLGDETSQDFALRGGSEIEEIVVFGQRSARAQALNQERSAPNSTTIVSSDLLGQFDGTTIAESLRRVPGVAFQMDPATGDGTNILIRGLNPDFNQVTFDGMRLPEGDGIFRSPDIGNILTESIDQVVISKSLLPSQDSSGTGGLVDITTKSPLDRDRRFATVAIAASQTPDFSDELSASAVFSGTFGSDEELGLGLAIQYREDERDTISYSAGGGNNFFFGRYLPLSPDGNPITRLTDVDPRIGFPFVDGVDDVYPNDVSSFFGNNNVENLSATLSAQWQPADHTDIIFSYTDTQREVKSLAKGNVSFTFQGYQPLPVDELEGEIRGSLVWEQFFGPFIPDGIFFLTQSYRERQSEEDTQVLSLRGKTVSNNWTFSYSAGHASAENNSIENGLNFEYVGGGTFIPVLPSEYLTPSARSNTNNGLIVSPYSPRSGTGIILPALTDDGFAFLNDQSNYQLDFLSQGALSGKNDRTSGKLSARHDFEASSVNYLELGAFYERSQFESFRPFDTRYNAVSGSIAAESLGLGDFTSNGFERIGERGSYLLLRDSDFVSVFDRIPELSTGIDPALVVEPNVINDVLSRDTFTREDELALYVEAQFEFGDFEVIGGVRYSRIDVTARNISTPSIIEVGEVNPDPAVVERLIELVDDEATQEEFLPRLLVNYRPSENFVARLAYYRTVARPQIINLSGRQNIALDLNPRFGPNSDQPSLTVFRGNPDLRPSITDSLDLSLELYDDNAGVLGVSLFYKDIQDFIEFSERDNTSSLDGVIFPDDPDFQNLPDNLFVTVSRPINNDRPAKIWGVELNAERRFPNLPGAFGGLGVYGNVTFTDSEKTVVFENLFDPDSGEFVDIEVDDAPFDQSPEYSGTFAVTYNKFNLDASLAYTFQSTRLQSFRGRNLSRYDDDVDSLDFRIEYRFNTMGLDWRAFFAASDVLKGNNDPNVLTFVGGDGSAGKYYTDGSYLGGRSFAVGFRTVF